MAWKKISFKWKMAVALVITGIFLLFNYALITRSVYENDKIESIFENQKAQLTSLKKDVLQEFNMALLAARAVIAAYDPAHGLLSPSGNQIFLEEKSLLALELWNEKDDRILFRIEKSPGTLPSVAADEKSMASDQLHVQPINSQNFLAFLRYSQHDPQFPLRLRAVFHADHFLTGSSSSLLLVYKNEIVAAMGPQNIPLPVLESIAQGQAPDDLLITKSSLNDFPDYSIFAVNPRISVATQNSILIKRSLIFGVFALFTLLAVSLTISRNLELHLLKAREEAEGQIQKQIQNLAHNYLLPAPNEWNLDGFRIAVENGVAEVYAGNWWNVFHQDDEITVAIANSSAAGARAALMAAVSKTLFTGFAKEELSLEQILERWQGALDGLVDESNLYRIILARVNTKTGQGQYLCSHHAPPFILDEQEQGYQFNLPDFESATTAKDFVLRPNSSLILYTESFLGQTTAQAQGDFLTGKAELCTSPTDLLKALAQAHKADVTLLQLRRQGPVHEFILASDSGDLHREAKDLGSLNR